MRVCSICGSDNYCCKGLCKTCYSRTPERKAYAKMREQLPDVKAYRLAYSRRSDVKAHAKERDVVYNQLPEVKARKRKCSKHWQKDNPERVKANKERWNKAHPGRRSEISTNWQKANRGRATAHCRKWRETNPEKARVSGRLSNAKWRKENPDESQAAVLKWKIANIEKVQAHMMVQLAKIPMIECVACSAHEYLIRHHPDYNRPLEVIVLCKRCHVKEHRNAKKIGGTLHTVEWWQQYAKEKEKEV